MGSIRMGVKMTLLLCSLSLLSAQRASAATSDQQSMDELQNTVINILEAMVQKGLLTADQAKQIVQNAKEKAAASAAQAANNRAAQEKADEGAVRVPYVPQVVKDEISKQVATEVKPAVVASVMQEAKEQKWGVPAALPDWISRISVFGDIVIREQADMYPKANSLDNSVGRPEIFDFNAINQAGGYSKVFPSAALDTFENRDRMRIRARVGVESDLSPNLTAVVRLASGSLTDPSSESQTEGTYGQHYPVGIDLAYVTWNAAAKDRLSWMTASGGRMPNPWFSPTELVYARDLTFEGLSSTWRLGWGAGDNRESHVFATLGAIPMLEVPLTASANKWLVGAQLGMLLNVGDDKQLRLAAAYYDFLHVSGVQSAVGLADTGNPTIPAFLRYGNTVFPLENGNPADPNDQLSHYGLAAHFRLIDLAAGYQWNIGSRQLLVNAEAVRNKGYNRSAINALTDVPTLLCDPTQVAARQQCTVSKNQNTGYVAEVGYGDPTIDHRGQWRARMGYRYVASDAVLDAWTDADFHGGGTNAQGYYIWGEMGVAPRTWLRLRYMSSNEVTGFRFGLDTVQLDLNTRF